MISKRRGRDPLLEHYANEISRLIPVEYLTYLLDKAKTEQGRHEMARESYHFWYPGRKRRKYQYISRSKITESRPAKLQKFINWKQQQKEEEE